MMKHTAAIFLACSLLFMIACSTGSKLTQEELEKMNYQEVYGLLDVSEVKEKPDQMPQYPKGNGGLIADIQKHQSYPQSALEKEIEGNVIIGFTVAKNGDLENVEVEKSVHPSIDSAAVNIMGKLHPWYPGQIDGEVVPVRLKTLVTFRMPMQNSGGVTQ